MQVTVHSVAFQVFILSLVALDAMIVLFELLLDVGAFGKCELHVFYYSWLIAGIIYAVRISSDFAVSTNLVCIIAMI